MVLRGAGAADYLHLFACRIKINILRYIGMVCGGGGAFLYSSSIGLINQFSEGIGLE